MQLDDGPTQAVSLSLQARPFRLGIVVADVPDIPWQDIFASALSSQTRIWGGQASIIFPFEERPEDDELLWAMVDLLDPDTWELFVASTHDLADLSPTHYATWRAHVDKELAKVSADERDEELARAHLNPLVDETLTDELSRLLVRRGAALHHDGLLSTHGGLSGSHVPWPLTDALKLRPLPDAIIDPQVDEDPTARLLVAAEFGVLSSPLREELASLGVSTDPVKPADRLELLRWLFADYRLNGVAPFAIGETGLAWFRPVPLIRDNITIVAGEGSRDFMLSYAIRRAKTFSWWWPESLFEVPAERDYALRTLATRALRGHLPIVVTSATDPDAAKRVAADLHSAAYQPVSIELKSWDETLPDRANRLQATAPVGFPERLPLEDGATDSLPTPIPRVEPVEPIDLRWMADIGVRDWTAARHSALGNHLVVAGDRDARTTRTGVSYVCPHPWVGQNTPLEYQTLRPRFRPLNVLEQLEAIGHEAGWECRLSVKGQFAEATSQRFGGFKELCAKLREPDVAAILSIYLDGSKDAPGLALSHKRRYLTLEELDYVCPGAGGPVVEELESRGVLVRGLVLKCEHCRHTDWYRPRTVDPIFSCIRCDTEQRPERRHWLFEHEPAWRYRLQETIFQLLINRSDLPALTVFERFGQSRMSVMGAAELEFERPDGEMQEVDFAVVEAGHLWIGEAFTSPKYSTPANEEKKRLARLAALAESVNARGVILATAAESLNSATRGRAEAAFPGSWPKLEIRERAFTVERPENLIETEP